MVSGSISLSRKAHITLKKSAEGNISLLIMICAIHVMVSFIYPRVQAEIMTLHVGDSSFIKVPLTEAHFVPHLEV